MSVTFRMSGYEIGEFEIEQFPATNVSTGSKAGGVLLLICSLVFGGVPMFVLVSTAVTGSFHPVMLVLLIPILIGTALSLRALTEFFKSKVSTISEREVAVRSRTLLGLKSWSEPLDRYEGVLSRKKRTRGKNAQTIHVVELHHPEKHKTICLYASMSDSGLRAKWECYCKKLRMPALENDGVGLMRRDENDLDKSVRELAEEGKLTLDFDPTEPPPAGVSTRVDGDTFVVTIEKNRNLLLGKVVGLLFGGALIVAGFFLGDGTLIVGMIGIIMTLLVAFGSLYKPEIRINKDVVLVQYCGPWGTMAVQQICASDVESVTIASRTGKQGSEGVVLTSDAGELRFGDGLTRDVLEWVRKCIIAIIT